MKRAFTTLALAFGVTTILHVGQAFAAHGDMPDYPSTTDTIGALATRATPSGSSLERPSKETAASSTHLRNGQDELGGASHRNSQALDPRAARAKRAQAAPAPSYSDGTGRTFARPDEAGMGSHFQFDVREPGSSK